MNDSDQSCQITPSTSGSAPVSPATPAVTDHNKKIEQLINSAPVFVFMKGTPEQAICRFSAQVKHTFDSLGVKFKGYNILEDFGMRQAIKDYTNWPTLPQIFIKGNFIGGADILEELKDSGELQNLIN